MCAATAPAVAAYGGWAAERSGASSHRRSALWAMLRHLRVRELCLRNIP